jgi:hypothetical protein
VTVTLLALALWAPAAGAQQPSDEPSLLLILDASGSMNAKDGTGRAKIDSAKEALRGLVDGLTPGAPVGLRVYGHRVSNTDKANGCRDSELVAPVRPLDAAAMKAAIGSFGAKGFTPIGFSLQEAAKDLPTTGERTIILVSDGADTCAPPDACDVAKDLSAKGIDVKIQTIGFDVDAAARGQLQCIAAATGGEYVDAPDAARLRQTLTRVSARALRLFQARGVPVRGGPTVEQAVKVTPDQYLDVVTTNADKWYAVDLAEGERVAASATLVLKGTSISRGAGIDVEIYDAPGHRFESRGDTVGAGSNISSAGTAGPRVATGRATQYVRVKVNDIISDDNRGAAIPLELLVFVDGRKPSVVTTVAPARTAASGRARPEDDDDNLLLLVALGAVALALGAALGWSMMGRRRR